MIDVDLRALEDVDHAPRQIERGRFLAGVHHQGAAAGLIGGRDHFAAFGRQHAHRGRVDLRHEFALDASQQQAHALALLGLARELRRRSSALAPSFGISASIARNCFGSSFSNPDPRTRDCKPDF